MSITPEAFSTLQETARRSIDGSPCIAIPDALSGPPVTLEVFASRNRGGTVYLEHGEDGIHLTPENAYRLAAALLAGADIVESAAARRIGSVL